MRLRMLTLLLPAAVLVSLTSSPAAAQPPKEYAADEAALVKNAEGFVKAFGQGDAKAVAAFWTADGDYIDEAGKHLKGRPSIEKAFAGLFAENKGLKLRINIDSLRFVTPELAVADGVTEVLSPDGAPPSRARYTAVHVKKDGQWQLASVRDTPFVPPTNYEHLKGLEWMLGEWADADDKGETARVVFEWADNQNWMVSSFTTTVKNVALGGGTQWIGWDPAAKKIRSWTFGVDGGFGEATWSADGDRWVVQSRSVLPDGKTVKATNVITRLGADTVTWQSVDRSVDDNPLPDVPAVRMKRVE